MEWERKNESESDDRFNPVASRTAGGSFSTVC